MRLDEFTKPVKRTLYVSRKLLNAEELQNWAKKQGFETCVTCEDMHVTIVYSNKEVDCSKVFPKENDLEIASDDDHPRSVKKFGDDKNAVVLAFYSKELESRNKFFIDEVGCSVDHEFKPHVTITYNGKDLDIAGMQAFEGNLKFGPEHFEEIVDSNKIFLEDDL